MTADRPDDFPYEPVERSLDPSVKRAYWDFAMGLQQVDGLIPSPYLRKLADGHVSGAYTLADTAAMLRAYYAKRDSSSTAVGGASSAPGESGEREADFVSQRIAELLVARSFVFAPAMLVLIHSRLFGGLDEGVYHPGKYKDASLQKSEFILNGDSVSYADPSLIDNALAFAFSEEGDYRYAAGFDEAQLDHFSRFVARIWQVHPFFEGNTRTVAVFAVLYLNDLGFDVDNEPFAQHAEYFRNALVRANYRNAKAGVMPDRGYLNRFFDFALNGNAQDLNSQSLIARPLFDDPSLLRNVDPSRALFR